MSIRVQEIMAGGSGAGGAFLRTAASIAEPFCGGAVSLRNWCYDRSGGTKLDRPVVSVGNITTGGTGKTPAVRWLAEAMRERGLKPAILMRGYRADADGKSDEQMMLQRQLPEVPVRANPDRIQAARELLQSEREVDLFLLDDGFQHRQVARDFDLVLIDATYPFGFGHVLPRGLLRERLSGLRRASAFLITRIGQVGPADLSAIEQTLRRYNLVASIYRADHRLEAMPEGKVFAFAGIGNPKGFEKQLASAGKLVGAKWFEDHHAYSAEDVEQVRRLAKEAGAECVVTTEKDWVKLEGLVGSEGPAIVPVGVRIRFDGEDEPRLLEEILKAIRQRDGLTAKPSAECSRDKPTPPRREEARR